MLRAEECARALRASRNRKQNSVQRAGSIKLPAPSKVETVHEIILKPDLSLKPFLCLELELIQTQMAQKPMLRAEVGMRVRCANKASAE